MAPALPVRADVALETTLFHLGNAPPNRFSLGPQGIDNGAPIEAARRRGVDVAAKAAQQDARVVRLERGNHVVGCDVGVRLREPSAAREHVNRPAMPARVQRNQHVERRQAGTDQQDVTADATIVETPRIRDVAWMQAHLHREKIVDRQRIAGRQHDRASVLSRTRIRLDDEAVVLGPHRRHAFRDRGKTNPPDGMPHRVADIIAVESPRHEIARPTARPEPAHEMVRIVGEHAHRLRARVQEMLAMRRAVGGAASELALLKKREREAGLRAARQIRGDGTAAEAPADDRAVDGAHKNDGSV